MQHPHPPGCDVSEGQRADDESKPGSEGMEPRGRSAAAMCPNVLV